jgi:hypothetical protein
MLSVIQENGPLHIDRAQFFTAELRPIVELEKNPTYQYKIFNHVAL